MTDLLFITKNFTWSEAACHDGTPIPEALKPNAILLASQLEILRAQWGGPIITVSWYRSPEYNEALRQAAIKAGRTPGTAKDSTHMKAMAIDCRPLKSADFPAFKNCVERCIKQKLMPKIGGWGLYTTWVHLDVRPLPPSGRLAFWLGTGVASEMA